MIRSGLRPANSCAMPASSSPTSASAGSRTSSMKTLNCFSGLTISMSIGANSKPSASVGTTNRQGLSRPVRASSARATTSTAPASSTPEM